MATKRKGLFKPGELVNINTSDVKAQAEAVETLERNGYTWKYTSDEFGFIVLARKIGAGMIQHVEVDEDGLCNGLLLHDYLKEVTVLGTLRKSIGWDCV